MIRVARRARGHSFRVAVLSIPMLAAASAPVFASLWYEHFERGEAALAAKDWAEAINQFTQAIEKKGDPGVRVRTYGVNFINYHPYLKLGIAYFQMGRYDAALQAFDTEERLGAIANSPSDLKDLKELRARSQEAGQAAKATEQDRIVGIVAKSLSEARELQEAGQLDRAMAALGRGLTVAPESREILAAMQQLRDQTAAAERDASLRERVAAGLEEAKALLDSGKHQEASAVLSQLLLLKPNDDEVRRLLGESQEKLRAALQAEAGPGDQRRLVQEALAAAARLEKEGKTGKALEQIQSVLAVDPQNGEALASQSRLIQLQTGIEAREFRDEEVANLLRDAELAYQTGQYEQALAGSNRALALEPGNLDALAKVARVYRQMNRAILREGTVSNLPPGITFLDLTNAEADGAREQRVSSPDLTLSGMVIDDSAPLQVVFLDAHPDGSGAGFVNGAVFDDGKVGDLFVNLFHQRFALRPGVTVLQVVAKDPGGLTSTASYRVNYMRPLGRSPWLYSGLALLGIATIAGVQVRRISSRNQLLRRRFNPYVAGAPVLRDDMFVGRETLLRRILETIHNNSILLYGERRIGKTSIQHHLKKRLEQIQDSDYRFHPVYIDLQGTPQTRFFATLALDIFSELAPILDEAGIRREIPEGRAYDYPEFIRDVHQVLKVLKAQGPKKAKLVLLIDEIDELNSYEPRINQKLRSLFMKSFAEDLVAVVSGVAINKHWASEGSPWYNFFEEIEVKPFTRSDAEVLIENPIRGVFKLDKGVVDRIIANTDCKPYLIQKLCVALVNRMHDEGRRRITATDVEMVGRPVAS